MRFIFVPLLVAGLTASTLAQSPQFVLSSRDRANLLAVDFVATGAGGTPVTDLTEGDITVRLGGKVRPVLALEYVHAEPHTTAASTRHVPYGDNTELLAPRSIVLIVDEDTIQPGRTITVRDAAQRLLAGLSPADRVALVTVPFGGLAVDLTTDHTRVLQAMGSLTAKGLRTESNTDAQCRTLSTLGAITDTLLRLSAVENPVTVVFFSSHQAGPPSIIRMTGTAPVSGPCDLRTSTFTDLGNAASRARARFYIVHSDINQRSGLDGLEHMTGVTGGPLLHLAMNNGEAAVSRILAETSGHFIVRVARDASDSVGETLPVSLSTTRSGVTLWRAPRFVVTRPVVAATATPTTTLDLMKHQRTFRDLPLRVTGHTFRSDAAGNVRLAVTLDADGGTNLSSAMVGAFDAAGRMVAGLEMSSEALTHRPVVAALEVPPGEYRLRLAALETSGRAGSAEQRVEAFLTPVGPLEASSLMIGLSRSGAFLPAMEFSDQPTAFGLLELYGTFASAPRVVFEIAATENGPALQTMPGLVEATGDRTRSLVTVVLPISALTPGDYVVRATITPEGSPSARVVRVFRKVGAQPVKKPSH